MDNRWITGRHLNKDSLQPIISQADELYAGRADLAKVSRSIELLRDAKADSYEIAWRLSRALFFLGQETPDRALGFHRRGVKAGRHAVGLKTERVEGHFWLAVNLALLAQVAGPFSALRHALNARRSLQAAIALNRAYHGAGPLRVLARLQHKLPRWLGGGVADARANFERAIGIAPEATVTRIYFAELLVDLGEVKLAREELESVLSVPLDPDWSFEINRDRQLAKELIGKLG